MPGEGAAITELLQTVDGLVSAFDRAVSKAAYLASSIAASEQQQQNLARFAARLAHPSAIHEKTLLKIQSAIESSVSGIRDQLQTMDAITERMQTVLFQTDLLLAESGSALLFAQNPQEALRHISAVYDAHQAELIERREKLADWTAGEITGEQLAAVFKETNELNQSNEAEMDGLLASLSSFGQATEATAMSMD